VITDGPDLSSTRLSLFNSDMEKCVPDEFQECSQMNTSERKSYGWLNGLAADFCDEGIAKLMQRLNKCLNRNGD
jgi:hypothetical protein